MSNLKELLEQYKQGLISYEETESHLKTLPYKDIDFAKIDHHRKLRHGFPEVIFCPGKTKEQICKILEELRNKNGLILATRADKETAEYVLANTKECEYNEQSRVIVCGKLPEVLSKNYVLVATAGTADLPVAYEAITVLRAFGIKVKTIFDCGVAGSHRIFAEIEKIQKASAVIAIAGMEGALASFIGGLASSPVVAVPTSVGYGAAFGGIAALLGMLNSCSSNVSVVNIDNGFGAAYISAMIIKQAKN
ncbi:MAG: nickel pincer cofactor biosynthesis protein LarB [bacterium]